MTRGRRAHRPWVYGLVALHVVAVAIIAGPRTAARERTVSLPTTSPSATVSSDRVLGPAQPNIFLITIDTLRPDHLHGYGYPRLTSPTIDRLMQTSVTFTNAWAPSSWTPPSVASLMTGLYPSRHQVQDNLYSRELPQNVPVVNHVRGIVYQDELAAYYTTLAERLQAAGYTTCGVSGNTLLQQEFGFGQGFTYFDDAPRHRKAEELTDILARWQTVCAQSPPFFLWVHYFDPHTPYYPFEPYTTSWTPTGYAGPRTELIKAGLGDLVADYGLTPGDAIVEYLQVLYDSEIRYTDEHLKRLLDDYAWDASRDILIITSDHGEEFLEHGMLEHGHQLYPETLRVPLIISLPRSASRRTIHKAVSLLDVYPTVLEAVGVPAPSGLEGRSLLSLWQSDSRTRYPARPIFAELEAKKRKMTSIYYPPYFYVVNELTGEETMFHVESDAEASRELADRRGVRVEKLRKMLAIHRTGRRREAPRKVAVELGAEEIEALRAFGYFQ